MAQKTGGRHPISSLRFQKYLDFLSRLLEQKGSFLLTLLGIFHTLL
jgi:hypothetical protein